jgi:hypothetical protein
VLDLFPASTAQTCALRSVAGAWPAARSARLRLELGTAGVVDAVPTVAPLKLPASAAQARRRFLAIHTAAQPAASRARHRVRFPGRIPCGGRFSVLLRARQARHRLSAVDAQAGGLTIVASFLGPCASCLALAPCGVSLLYLLVTGGARRGAAAVRATIFGLALVSPFLRIRGFVFRHDSSSRRRQICRCAHVRGARC